MATPEQYKDKIEVNLDGRQIFYMFFGGSVIVGLVFVLGVMVGRRVEARGHTDHAHTSANVDPLAALDRLEGSGGLSFQGALSGTPGAGDAGDVEKTIGALAAAKKEPAAVAVVSPAAAPVKKADPAAVAVAKKDEKAEKAEKKDEAKSDRKKADDGDKKKPDDGDKTAKADKSDKKKSDDGDKPKEEKIRYTLQLSSFQDKSEARAFLENMKSAGYEATLTEAEVEGKGTFYRVRYGLYHSLDAATEAKAGVEKAAHKSASIMRL